MRWARARKNALAIEVRRDAPHTHLARCAIAFQGKPVYQPHCVGVQQVDFQSAHAWANPQ
jgi:hypothetical protein